MDSNTQKEATMPKLCAAGCGFFANPDLNELCSKCNRERQASEAAAKAIASSAAPAIASAQSATAVPQPVQLSAPQSQQQFSTVTSAPAAPTVLQSPSLPANPPASPAGETAAATPEQLPPPLSPKVLEAVSAAAASVPSRQHSSVAAAALDAADEEPPRRVQKNTNRCFSCNKKVGLTGFKCRCGYVFCGPHRLAEAHSCDFDYKGVGRESLAKANPLVQADRVTRF